MTFTGATGSSIVPVNGVNAELESTGCVEAWAELPDRREPCLSHRHCVHDAEKAAGCRAGTAMNIDITAAAQRTYIYILPYYSPLDTVHCRQNRSACLLKAMPWEI